MVTQTSLESWMAVRSSLSEKQDLVFNCIRSHGPIHNRKISMYTQLPINTITPTVFRLRSKELVESAGIGFDETTSRNVQLWQVRDVVAV